MKCAGTRREQLWLCVSSPLFCSRCQPPHPLSSHFCLSPCLFFPPQCHSASFLASILQHNLIWAASVPFEPPHNWRSATLDALQLRPLCTAGVWLWSLKGLNKTVGGYRTVHLCPISHHHTDVLYSHWPDTPCPGGLVIAVHSHIHSLKMYNGKSTRQNQITASISLALVFLEAGLHLTRFNLTLPDSFWSDGLGNVCGQRDM